MYCPQCWKTSLSSLPIPLDLHFWKLWDLQFVQKTLSASKAKSAAYWTVNAQFTCSQPTIPSWNHGKKLWIKKLCILWGAAALLIWLMELGVKPLSFRVAQSARNFSWQSLYCKKPAYSTESHLLLSGNTGDLRVWVTSATCATCSR